MLTQSRPYPSKSGISVPQFLPNAQAKWHKRYPNVDKHFRAADFANEIASILSDSPELLRPTTTTELSESRLQDDDNKWNLLGLRAYKTTNVDKAIFNILTALPGDSTRVADFHQNLKSQIIYNYARTVKKSKDRCPEDKKAIKQFMKTMPARPEGTMVNGFPEGTAATLVKQLRGENHKNVLERVMDKIRHVQITAKKCYSDTQALATDQAILDSLPNLEFFTSVSNSVNVGKKLYWYC